MSEENESTELHTDVWMLTFVFRRCIFDIHSRLDDVQQLKKKQKG